MFGFKSGRKLPEPRAELAAIRQSHAVAEFNLDGTIISANEKFSRIVGYDLSEIVGMHHSLFVAAADRDSPAYQEFWAQIRGGESQAGVFRRIARGSRETWLQAAYAPVFDVAGKPNRVIEIATDVTRAHVESADHKGQADAIDRSLAVIAFGLDGTILTANANFQTVMGYAPAEIIGHSHRMFIDPAERDSPGYRDFWAALARGEHRMAEFRRITKDGREVWLQATYCPILNADGVPCKVVKFAADVTAARGESANNKGQIEAINRSQAVIEFTLDGTILSANENFLHATGYSAAEVIGQHHRMFVDRDERERPEYQAFWQALGRGEFRAGEFRRVRKGGSEVWLRATYNAIYDLNGKPFKVVKFATDVTSQVVARMQFSGSIDTAATAARQLSQSITEISTTMLRSQETAGNAVRRVAETDESTHKLNTAARAMGRVVDLIGNITGQINLLALNATIESARAGEAGRGFAVVANEVKNLADQARRATEEIAKEIEGIRLVATEVVEGLSAIRQAINSVSEFVTSTSSAVEEQSAVTETISVNMKTAATQAGNLWAA